MAMADAYPHHAGYPTDRLVGAAPAIAALRAQVRHLATFDTVGSPHIPTVLLQGETGTGKGLVARVIHDSGSRASGPFIEVNCAAIPETMLEAELFGFDPGAFTDTKRAKPGLFEAASGGTLFLDEIGALPLVLQGKLITALEAKRVRRLGAVTERGVDVKLIAATNVVLPEVVAAGRFRAGLYHRLAVVVLGLPPLRDRGTDIVALAEAFVQHYTAAHGLPPKRLSSEAEAWLQGYAWPGNVRELSHVMERVTLLHIGEEVDAKTQYHQQIAQVVEEQFPEIAATQPEWLAHHYTAAGLGAQAIPYWQRAGQGAIRRSANLEAFRHLTTGLALLARLPETPVRAQQELDLQIALGPALVATKGYAAPEVEQTYAQARTLCAQVGETPQLFPTLRSLCRFYLTRGALPTARELGEQLDRLAQRVAAPMHRLEAHGVLGGALCFLGEYAAARAHCEQGVALTDLAAQQVRALHHDIAPGVVCLIYATCTLWCLGYPAQAVRRSQEALSLARTLEHPLSLASAHHFAAFLYQRRGETAALQAQAEALLNLSTAQGFPLWIGFGTFWHGWALAMQGREEEGLAQMHQGMTAVLATGQTLAHPLCLVLLAEATGHAGHVAEGLHLLTKALTVFEAGGRGDLLTEAYRLQGELLLRQATPDAAQAEACFQQALTIARRQQAKSWELRGGLGPFCTLASIRPIVWLEQRLPSNTWARRFATSPSSMALGVPSSSPCCCKRK
jgi:transcriptional regulator with AAA-type ATPase domain/predicted ATPase